MGKKISVICKKNSCIIGIFQYYAQRLSIYTDKKREKIMAQLASERILVLRAGSTSSFDYSIKPVLNIFQM